MRKGKRLPTKLELAWQPISYQLPDPMPSEFQGRIIVKPALTYNL